MSRLSRQLVTNTILAAVIGGLSGSVLGSVTFPIREGTITSVDPGTNTVEIGHRRCHLPARGAVGAMSSGQRTTINDLQPGMQVRYAVTGSAKHRCTIRMLWPAKPTHKE